jgi:hypothetical protein
MSMVEVMVGVVVLVLCLTPILGCVSWIRGNAADSSIEAAVASKLAEDLSRTHAAGRATRLSEGVVDSAMMIPIAGATGTGESLGSGVLLNTVRTVTAVSGQPRLFDVRIDGTWTSRGAGGKPRSMTMETYVFAPEN